MPDFLYPFRSQGTESGQCHCLVLSLAFSPSFNRRGGRGFCAYCPISAISNAFAYGRKRFLSFPGAMKKYGIWVGIAAFVSIFWIEYVTEAFFNPHVTGVVFLSISGSAIITALLFGKRIWCLHICPLGRMLGDLAMLSLTELRGNSLVCLRQCENRACLKEKNCPMGLHPSTERTRHDCILCFACVKKCKQKSVHLDVLLPHQRVLAMKSWNLSRTTFVVLLTGSVLASDALRWLGAHRAFTVPPIPGVHPHAAWEDFLAGVAIAIGFAALTFLVSGAREAFRVEPELRLCGIRLSAPGLLRTLQHLLRPIHFPGQRNPPTSGEPPGLRPRGEPASGSIKPRCPSRSSSDTCPRGRRAFPVLARKAAWSIPPSSPFLSVASDAYRHNVLCLSQFRDTGGGVFCYTLQMTDLTTLNNRPCQGNKSSMGARLSLSRRTYR